MENRKGAEAASATGGCRRKRGISNTSLLFISLVAAPPVALLFLGCGQGLFVDATQASSTATSRATYMDRFNIPKNHVDLIWEPSGSKSYTRGNITYRWSERKLNAGVYAGYSYMYDSSKHAYCQSSKAKIDTMATVGGPYMASGACPNYGKVISFTNRDGSNADMTRWRNEIHGNVMPHSTTGCATQGKPGDAEVAKAIEGFAMYSGYMTHCPFNENVYLKDMVPDREFDSNVCSFVTQNNPLRFLDTTQRQPGQAFTEYAFHGKGGHKGYDYKGQTSHVGCPPYSSPRITKGMKDSTWIRDPFDCSRLSRCTTHCWPYKSGSYCFRSLPSIYDMSTGECRILGYQTQDYRHQSCAEFKTDNTSAFYCVRPMKTAGSSDLVYVTSHTRPDYETKCPPREPLKKVKWGVVSQGKYCQPLAARANFSNVTAEMCGQKVFTMSSADDPSLSSQVHGYHWATFVADNCADMGSSCARSARGKCFLYDTVPECLISSATAMAFTSLSAVDPSIAIDPDSVAVLPLDKCVNTDCGSHGTCDAGTGKCVCSPGFKGDLCDKDDLCYNNKCSGHGTCKDSDGSCQCKPGYKGEKCETVDKCYKQDCSGRGTCDEATGHCKCETCYTGTDCSQKAESCCAADSDCGGNKACSMGTNECVCKEGWMGQDCQEKDLCSGVACEQGKVCDGKTGKCVCEETCKTGPNCDEVKPECCESNDECHQPQGYCKMDEAKCVCRPGFGGQTCETKEDLCAGVTCQNGGTCDSATGLCRCDACHGGKTCEIKKEHCCTDDNACNGHGTCNLKDNTCKCDAGFAGVNCSKPEGQCKNTQCLSGYCEPSTGTCVCDACHTGAKCETPVRDCCVTNQTCNFPNGFCSANKTCECQESWGHGDCSAPVDKCEGVKCHNGSVCDADSGTCICPPGFGDEFCETCAQKGCLNGGVCQPNGTCACPTGFESPSCDVPGSCPGAGGQCQNGGRCDVEQGRCVCPEGFAGSKCEEPASPYTCSEWCQAPQVLTESTCNPSIDCYEVCCEVMKGCAKVQHPAAPEQDWGLCYANGMDERQAACCYAREEQADNLVIYLAAGGVLLLLVAAGMAYGLTRKRSNAGQGGTVDFGVGADGKPVEGAEDEAIEVDLDDFKSHPDDEVDIGNRLGSTNWDA
uniref:EGF-like domain-containing protein, putative n=1 Tax=Neospora caninum (strain Liverpool) TaxID=572307 RepID=A0A0F7U344_NEOCL|nr:TPA: EGF-like domain-containing protein, putative [Neospora caninum Liverpool]